MDSETLSVLAARLGPVNSGPQKRSFLPLGVQHMNPLTSHKSRNQPDPDCADLIAVAEKELAAFFSAVAELFGSEQARRAAGDWFTRVVPDQRSASFNGRLAIDHDEGYGTASESTQYSGYQLNHKP